MFLLSEFGATSVVLHQWSQHWEHFYSTPECDNRQDGGPEMVSFSGFFVIRRCL